MRLERDGETDLDVERASPSTVTRQPVWRRSQSGSRSVVQYQVARKLQQRLAASDARDRHALGRHRAGRDVPAAISRRRRGRRDLAGGLDRVERQAERLGHEPQRRTEAPCAVGHDRGRRRPDRFRSPSGRTAARASPLATGRRTPRSTGASSRRWIEVRTSGTASEMNPGLLPVLWIEVPPSRQAASTRLAHRGSMLAG